VRQGHVFMCNQVCMEDKLITTHLHSGNLHTIQILINEQEKGYCFIY